MLRLPTRERLSSTQIETQGCDIMPRLYVISSPALEAQTFSAASLASSPGSPIRTASPSPDLTSLVVEEAYTLSS